MSQVHFILPGDPETLTGGYLYDKRIIAGLRDVGWQVEVAILPDGFPNPGETALNAARTILAALPDDALVVVDGLALGAMPDIALAEARRLRLVGLVHHPLAQEGGLEPARRALLEASERRALMAVRRVIVTSETTARALAAYDVDPECIRVVRPGIDPCPLARGSGGPGVGLLCVATLTARKGHLPLLEALAGLMDRAWHLSCVGGAEHEPETAAQIAEQIRALGLEGRVTLRGAVPPDELTAHYSAADLFVLASSHEGYGMALAEALANGLPIVSTTAGAIPETLAGEAALLVPPGDVSALRAALGQALDDADLRARLAAGARAARGRLNTWPQAAARFAGALNFSAGAFAASWLALREPLDHRARDVMLLFKLLAWRRSKGSISVVDLGSGSGANLRHLAPHLGGRQSWRLIDQDAALLAGATYPTDPQGALTVETLTADLADTDLDGLVKGADLVTAASLMDLAAAAWFDRLAKAAARQRAALYVALTYDGHVSLTPHHRQDGRVLGLVNAHQRRDKGLGGPALGPTATDHMIKTLESLGYRVETAPAEWRLGPQRAELIEHLVTGWAEAAMETEPEHAKVIAAWRKDRLADLRRGVLRARVGHWDLLALPPD